MGVVEMVSSRRRKRGRRVSMENGLDEQSILSGSIKNYFQQMQKFVQRQIMP